MATVRPGIAIHPSMPVSPFVWELGSHTGSMRATKLARSGESSHRFRFVTPSNRTMTAYIRSPGGGAITSTPTCPGN